MVRGGSLSSISSSPAISTWWSNSYSCCLAFFSMREPTKPLETTALTGNNEVQCLEQGLRNLALGLLLATISSIRA